MAIERTLSIIKPDATRRNLTGQINARFEAAGLRIVAQRRIRLSRGQAEAFYAVHRERPFYRSLCEFMTSGPVVVQVLEGENAIETNRAVMGATDPAKAASGTIRKDFAESIEANSVHGSDAADTAAREIFPLGTPVDGQIWLGRRPCLPDMLPIVGPAPRHRGLWLDFGHHHLGFTLGPVTGRLLAEMMTRETPFTDPAPYRAERF